MERTSAEVGIDDDDSKSKCSVDAMSMTIICVIIAYSGKITRFHLKPALYRLGKTYHKVGKLSKSCTFNNIMKFSR